MLGLGRGLAVIGASPFNNYVIENNPTSIDDVLETYSGASVDSSIQWDASYGWERIGYYPAEDIVTAFEADKIQTARIKKSLYNSEVITAIKCTFTKIYVQYGRRLQSYFVWVYSDGTYEIIVGAYDNRHYNDSITVYQCGVGSSISGSFTKNVLCYPNPAKTVVDVVLNLGQNIGSSYNTSPHGFRNIEIFTEIP